MNTNNRHPLYIVIFLWSVSSLMVLSIVTIYHESVLCLSKKDLGTIQAFASISTYPVKLIFGMLLDSFPRYRGILLTGSLLTAIVKPLFAYAQSYSHVFYLRNFERFLKGARSIPADTYISLACKTKESGAAFAYKQIAITTGAIVGCLLAAAILKFTQNNFKLLFQCAAIPAAIATIIIWQVIKDPPQKTTLKTKQSGFFLYRLLQLPTKLWLLFLLIFAVTAARCGEVFLGHRLYEAQVEIHHIPLVYLYYEIPFAVVSFLTINLFDRGKWKKTILWSLVFLGFAHLLLWRGQHMFTLILGVILGGIHMGSSQGLFLAMITRYSPTSVRGTAFSVYHVITGLGMFASGKLMGFVGNKFDSWRPAFGLLFAITLFIIVILSISSYIEQKTQALNISDNP